MKVEGTCCSHGFKISFVSAHVWGSCAICWSFWRNASWQPSLLLEPFLVGLQECAGSFLKNLSTCGLQGQRGLCQLWVTCVKLPIKWTGWCKGKWRTHWLWPGTELFAEGWAMALDFNLPSDLEVTSFLYQSRWQALSASDYSPMRCFSQWWREA